MNRKTQITYTTKFLKDYPYAYDGFNYFMAHWMYPFLDKVYDSRKEAYDAIDTFIKRVKNEFKKFSSVRYLAFSVHEFRYFSFNSLYSFRYSLYHT